MGYNGSTELVMMWASSATSLVIMTSAILPSNFALSWIKRVVNISSSLFEVMFRRVSPLIVGTLGGR